MRITLAAVICALFFAVTTACQEIPWREITIESRWGGLAQPENLKLVIAPKNGAILLGKHRVDPKSVDALIASLTSTVQAAPTPSNLGITQNWLERNVQIPQEGAPNQQALFRENYTDSKTIAELLPFAFKFVKFDDYPQLTVTVALKDVEADGFAPPIPTTRSCCLGKSIEAARRKPLTMPTFLGHLRF